MKVDPSAEPRNTPHARNTSDLDPDLGLDPDLDPDPGLALLAGPRRLLRAVVSRIPLPLRGLRSRLLISFVLVAMASSLGTGALAVFARRGRESSSRARTPSSTGAAWAGSPTPHPPAGTLHGGRARTYGGAGELRETPPPPAGAPHRRRAPAAQPPPAPAKKRASA